MMLKQPFYNGLKTGITEAAGPCLSASYEKEGNSLVVILLGSKSMEARWQEVPQLVSWALYKLSCAETNPFLGLPGPSKKENVL